MRRPIVIFLLALLLASPACYQSFAVPSEAPISTPSETATVIAPTEPPELLNPLRRGINLGNMLEAPNEGDWGLTVEEQYFDIIQRAGFDFIRLPIRWSTHAEADWPHTVDPEFLARIDEIVGWAMERDLHVILDFHHFEEMMADPWSNKDRFIGIWGQIAGHYKDYPSTVLFELLNEPNDQLDAALWNQYLRQALELLRQTNPRRDVVLGPAEWNAADWLSTLDLPDDEHLIVTFHYYGPFEFTHQGAEWVGSESQQWLGQTWGSDGDKAEVSAHFDLVAEWAERKKVRILLGEFGVYEKAELDQRAGWTAFVREEAERHGFAWAYWEFASNFGAYDPLAGEWLEELLKALIP